MDIRIYDLRIRRYRAPLCITALLLVLVLMSGFALGAYLESDMYRDAALALSEDKLIIIDAGHGGEDPGTIAVNGRYEKDINLEVAFTVGAMLSERGYAVLYTRTTDRLMYSEDENIRGLKKINDLKNRCKIAAEYPSALFVSIHMNSFSDPEYSGLQVYYTKTSHESRQLAASVQEAVNRDIGGGRSVRGGEGLYLLERCVNTAVLIECGFLSNPEEAEKLSKKEYQKRLSSAIICGIIEYKEKQATHKIN